MISFNTSLVSYTNLGYSLKNNKKSQTFNPQFSGMPKFYPKNKKDGLQSISSYLRDKLKLLKKKAPKKNQEIVQGPRDSITSRNSDSGSHIIKVGINTENYAEVLNGIPNPETILKPSIQTRRKAESLEINTDLRSCSETFPRKLEVGTPLSARSNGLSSPFKSYSNSHKKEIISSPVSSENTLGF